METTTKSLESAHIYGLENLKALTYVQGKRAVGEGGCGSQGEVETSKDQYLEYRSKADPQTYRPRTIYDIMTPNLKTYTHDIYS
ncbi:hypothetical protein SESBI_46321 [Sesbania bispinosa]|nr:hypothetical protein SESBI_46321 [Sesbania bispinosa]